MSAGDVGGVGDEAAGGEIGARWRAVRARVERACAVAGRGPDEVTLIAVSKLHPPAAIRAVVAAGARDLGENYAQELADKQAAFADGGALGPGDDALGDGGLGDVRWHFIGHLQRNKARLVAGRVALVHAVDGVALAAELGKRVPAGAVQPIVLAVNLAGEATKHGCDAAAAPALARAVAAIPGVRLDGLMTMPPPVDDAAASRPYFDGLRALRDRLRDDLGLALPVLSMGMSDDFEEAIACGATHVRVGTAIFGARPTR